MELSKESIVVLVNYWEEEYKIADYYRFLFRGDKFKHWNKRAKYCQGQLKNLEEK